MRKKLFAKKAFSIFLTILLILSSVSIGAYALNVGTEYTVSQTSTSYKYIMYWGDDGSVMSPSERGWKTFSKRTLASTGEPTYCLEFAKDFSSGTNATAKNITDTTAWKEASPAAQYGVTLASIYGYPHSYYGYGDAAYYATQVIMWEYMLGYRTNASATDPTYGITGGYDENNKCARFLLGIKEQNYTDVYTAYCGILADIANHTVKPNLNNGSFNLRLQYNPSTGKYTGTFNDVNGILSKYYVEASTKGIHVEQNGNSLTITSDKPISSENVAKLQLVKQYTNYENGVALFASNDMQTLLYGTLKDPQTVIFNVYTGLGKIVIQKNSEDGIIKGVKFQVTNSELGYDKTFETNASGKVEITDLVYGYTYTIKEIMGSQYVELPAVTATATEAGATVVFNNTLKKGSITVNKTDAVNHNPLSGAMFVIFEGDEIDWSRLYVDKSGNDTFLTDENGKLFINDIPTGEYSLFEAKSPDGYKTNDTLYHFTIQDSNTNLTFNIENERANGTLRITKTDVDDMSKYLSGAEFKIVAVEDIDGTEFKAGDTVAENIKTLADGTVEILLNPGRYELYETKAPAGYYCNPNKAYPFAISNGGEVVDLNITNKKIDVSIQKVSNRNVPLSGATISVYAADNAFNITDNTPIFTGRTSTTPLSLENLTVGNYVIKEIEAPFKYALPSDNILAHLTICKAQNADEYEVKFTNLFNGSYVQGNTLYAVNGPISIVIHKVDKETGKPISNAGFEMYANSSASLAFMTDSNGDAVFEGLIPNVTYVYWENVTPDGYYSPVDGRGNPIKHTFSTDEYGNIFDENGKKITTINAATGYPEITVENEKTVFEILKKDANTGKPLANATFAIYGSNGKFIEERTTDENGKIIFYGYPENSYYAVETKAPDGYALDKNTKHFFVIGTNAPTALTIENTPLSISFHKIDAETKLSLANAEYKLYVEKGGSYVKVNENTYVTDINGMFTISNGLKAGEKYCFIESKAPDGFYTDATPLYFVLSEDGVAYTDLTYTTAIEDNTILAEDVRTYFTIIKKDFETGEAIPNVTFEIKDENGRLIRTEKTNVNGEIKLYGLPEGTYFAYEIGFPDGYIHNTAPIKFTIGLSDNKDTLITNTQTKVTLKKVDAETGKAVANVLFDLYMTEGKETVKANENALKTDKNGEISLSKLKVNVPYYFIETQPANGYYSDTTTKYGFVINEAGEVCDLNGNVINKIIVKNTPTSINLLKVDADDANKKIAGVTFNIYAKNGTENGELVEVVTTNENGIANISRLPEGAYFAVEVGFPDGYIQDLHTRYDFEINASTKDAVIRIANKKTSVTLSKIDLVNGEPVEGATIEIYNQNHEIVYTGVTDKNGTITVDYLPIGTYTYRETINPDGYQINTYEYSFTLNADGSITNGEAITNAPTEVVITKTDTDGNPLAGALIGIYDANGNEVCRETTDENGQIVVRYLTAGDYTYKELEAPNGYKLNKNEFHFTVNRDGSVVGDNVMENETTSVTILKVDENDVPLAGSTIAIYDAEGNEVFRDVTNEFGKISVNGLYAGTYTYREVECPDGYVLDETLYSFTIDTEGNVDGENVIVNKQTSVEISKTDENGNPVEGATIGIFNEDGELLMTLVTDENGKAYAYGLLSGKYYFQEILPASGYEINSEKYEFEITREGFVNGSDTLVNKLTTVVINKTDENGKPLAGATIDVFNENGELVYEGVTDENGQIIIRGLPQGRYYAVEKEAPKGYLLNSEKVEFVIDDFGIVNGDIIITNAMIPVTVDIPQTGLNEAPTTIFFLLALTGLMLLIVLIPKKSLKRNKTQA